MSNIPEDAAMYNALGLTALGIMVGQVARYRNIPPDDVSVPYGEALPHIIEEITDLGINPPELVHGILRSYASLMMEPTNATLIRERVAALLWSILGDPENGGSPPAIYDQAASAMHLGLISMLDLELAQNA